MAVLEKTPEQQEASSSIDALLDSLSNETRHELLIRLIRDAIAQSGGKGLVPFTSNSGEDLGYFVPPAIADEHTRKLDFFFTPERLTRLRKAAATPDSTIDAEEFLRRLDEEDRD